MKPKVQSRKGFRALWMAATLLTVAVYLCVAHNRGWYDSPQVRTPQRIPTSSGAAPEVWEPAKPRATRPLVNLDAVRRGGGDFRPAQNFQEIISTSPFVLFVKGTDESSRYLRHLLTNEYEVTPEIAVVDLSKHRYSGDLQRYIREHKLHGPLFQLTENTPDVPYLFVKGESVINTSVEKDIREPHERGQLQAELQRHAGLDAVIKKRSPPSNS
ncbi:ACR146Wp [Eremothecium gossypii ATCC 10895]|uniref:ACR146Wp n=2 Tax=Eremothecium gossypii TaxID=33169 RepID=Q75BX5_EREGS|nr:ACR146Wp [Eremothecium gossypii ATCC 10895]AAS51372.1 ACR146Wp [Eremothecium gossypii ATCC 10895]AEY95663.1 FACR146Wp [Eremothecium gossypii FDAG1]